MNRATQQSWYQNAVIYGIDVATFQDSNGDGIGDFIGLCHRLDYLVDLEITSFGLAVSLFRPQSDNG